MILSIGNSWASAPTPTGPHANLQRACFELLHAIENNGNVSLEATRLQQQLALLDSVAEKTIALPTEQHIPSRLETINRERVHKVIEILNQNLAEPPALEEIGRRVGCSHFYLSRIFTQTTGRSISATLRDLRMRRAAELLAARRMNVTEVALEVGYLSMSHFSTVFREVMGCLPSEYPGNENCTSGIALYR